MILICFLFLFKIFQMSYYELMNDNLKLFMGKLNPTDESLAGGSKKVSSKNKKKKYNVIDFDWNDLIDEEKEDVYLKLSSYELPHSDSKETKNSCKKSKPKNKSKKVKHNTGVIGDEEQEANIEFLEKKEGISDEETDTSEELKSPIPTDVEKDDEDENDKIDDEISVEDDEKEDEDDEINIEDDEIEELIDSMNTETNTENKTTGGTENYYNYDSEDESSSDSSYSEDMDSFSKSYFDDEDKMDLEEIDNYISSYFNGLSGGQHISNIKDELGKDLNAYQNSVSLKGGNFKPIKSHKGSLYPYNLY